MTLLVKFRAPPERGPVEVKNNKVNGGHAPRFRAPPERGPVEVGGFGTRVAVMSRNSAPPRSAAPLKYPELVREFGGGEIPRPPGARPR